MSEQPTSPRQRLEEATLTFTKDRAFFDQLMQTPDVREVVNKTIVYMTLFDHLEAQLPRFIAKCARELFQAHAREASGALTAFLHEVCANVRLSAYLAIKGVFPQALAVMRQATEALAVYTHIWRDPSKAAFALDADTSDYAQAFRCGPNKAERQMCNAKGIKYKFSACKGALPLSRVYSLLSDYCVHTGSLKAICANVGMPDAELSCYFLRRQAPADLAAEYGLLHQLVALIHLELFQSIPKDRRGDEDILPLLFMTASLGPYLSGAFSFEEATDFIRSIGRSTKGSQSMPETDRG